MGGMGHVVRVGVTTGTVFAGSVGNAERGEYTFYGETVNMAARLMTSESNTSVLVDEHTMRDSAHEVGWEPQCPHPAHTPTHHPRPLSCLDELRKGGNATQERAGRRAYHEAFSTPGGQGHHPTTPAHPHTRTPPGEFGRLK
jgi:hypothetical protein